MKKSAQELIRTLCFLRLLETGFLPTDAPCDGEERETRFLCTSRTLCSPMSWRTK
ncbi:MULTISPECIES: hypothetical protein [unclassified Roseofilum]|uniref:hypothetical protein n=1 Tax=unclassified Roseofilum TaxID=2620099 RepID=UPI001B02DCD1|nr:MULTISPECIES: hypothetical protein [unclassified Roseofilum]MBP0010114.1 hypothetical protein [Roseofilum sp. Belize Diploria]MBP0034608.1 hypothetical protein [Roseofilum sp. Belize BBD 4]